jgi:hypothetical protein
MGEKMRLKPFLFASAVQLFLALPMTTIVNAQLPAFPGAKVLDSGANPVGLGKNISTPYIFTINLNSGFDNTKDLFDVVPAEFDVGGVAGGSCSAGTVGASCSINTDCDTALGSGDGICALSSIIASCGIATASEINKQAGVKLSPDAIVWDLDGCNTGSSQSLRISLLTDQNPGHGRRNISFFEPTSCGPLYLNDGAVLFDPATRSAVTEPSNALFVATCSIEGDPACVDQDGDGWTVACADPDDNNVAITPLDLDGDGIPNATDPCPSDPTNTCI